MRRSKTCVCGVVGEDEARREDTISRREAPRRRDMRRRRDWHSEARPAAAAAVAAAARAAVEGLAPIPPSSMARVPADRLVAAVAVGRRGRRRGNAISDGDRRAAVDSGVLCFALWSGWKIRNALNHKAVFDSG